LSTKRDVGDRRVGVDVEDCCGWYVACFHKIIILSCVSRRSRLVQDVARTNSSFRPSNRRRRGTQLGFCNFQLRRFRRCSCYPLYDPQFSPPQSQSPYRWPQSSQQMQSRT
jgi:hypothetical protein